MRCHTFAVTALVTLLLAPARSHAQSLEFQGMGTGANSHLKAEALFEVEPGYLKITLMNTSTADTVVPTDVLTGLFFQFNGGPSVTLSADSAETPRDNVIHFTPPPGDPVDIGGEWGFRSGLQSNPNNYGLSAVGLDDTFGQDTRFGGPNYTGPPSGSLNGIEWGLASMGDNPATGNGGTQNEALIRYRAIFRLAGLPIPFTLTEESILNVVFHYGSSASEPDVPGEITPEPGSLGLLGLAVAPLLRRLRRRAHRGRPA
jgi:MYXO-CTERM domain-containing protein